MTKCEGAYNCYHFSTLVKRDGIQQLEVYYLRSKPADYNAFQKLCKLLDIMRNLKTLYLTANALKTASVAVIVSAEQHDPKSGSVGSKLNQAQGSLLRQTYPLGTQNRSATVIYLWSGGLRGQPHGGFSVTITSLGPPPWLSGSSLVFCDTFLPTESSYFRYSRERV